MRATITYDTYLDKYCGHSYNASHFKRSKCPKKATNLTANICHLFLGCKLIMFRSPKVMEEEKLATYFKLKLYNSSGSPVGNGLVMELCSI